MKTKLIRTRLAKGRGSQSLSQRKRTSDRLNTGTIRLATVKAAATY